MSSGKSGVREEIPMNHSGEIAEGDTMHEPRIQGPGNAPLFHQISPSKLKTVTKNIRLKSLAFLSMGPPTVKLVLITYEFHCGCLCKVFMGLSLILIPSEI